MDSDRAGRKAAAWIAEDPSRDGGYARIVDLAPERDDGYDLSDWLRGGNNPANLSARWSTREAYTRIARLAAVPGRYDRCTGERPSRHRPRERCRPRAWAGGD